MSYLEALNIVYFSLSKNCRWVWLFGESRGYWEASHSQPFCAVVEVWLRSFGLPSFPYPYLISMGSLVGGTCFACFSSSFLSPGDGGSSCHCPMWFPLHAILPAWGIKVREGWWPFLKRDGIKTEMATHTLAQRLEGCEAREYLWSISTSLAAGGDELRPQPHLPFVLASSTYEMHENSFSS